MNRRKFLSLLALSPAVKAADLVPQEVTRLTAADATKGFFEEPAGVLVVETHAIFYRFDAADIERIVWENDVGFEGMAISG